MRKKHAENLLDTPILGVWRINLETALYILLGVIAVVACFYNLGARTQSHDESLHALYSWKLYAGDGYTSTRCSISCLARATLRRAYRRRPLG